MGKCFLRKNGAPTPHCLMNPSALINVFIQLTVSSLASTVQRSHTYSHLPPLPIPPQPPMALGVLFWSLVPTCRRRSSCLCTAWGTRREAGSLSPTCSHLASLRHVSSCPRPRANPSHSTAGKADRFQLSLTCMSTNLTMFDAAQSCLNPARGPLLRA